MSNPGLFKITIDGIDCSSYLYNGTFTKDTKQPVKYGAFRFTRNVANVLTVSKLLIGKSFKIERGFLTSTERIMFQGEIVNVRTTGSLYDFEVADKLYKAVIREYDYTFDMNTDTEAGVGSEIVKTLLTDIGLSYTTTSIPTTGTDTPFLLKNWKIAKSIISGLKDLGNIYYRQLFYRDAEDLVYFTGYSYENSSVILTVGDNVVNRVQWLDAGENIVNNVTFIGGEQLDWTTETLVPIAAQTVFTLTAKPVDTEIYVNSVKMDRGVDSADPKDFYVTAYNKQLIFTVTPYPNNVVASYSYNVPAKVLIADDSSITNYNQRDGTVINNAITNSDDAELRATNFLEQNSDALLSAPLRVLEENTLEVGQVVYVVDSQNSRTEYVVVNSIKYFFPFKPDEVTVGILPLNDNDVTIKTIGRVADLERQLATDSDINVQLITQEKTVTVEGWEKIYSAPMDSGVLYWDSDTQGDWDPTGFNWGDDVAETYTLIETIYINGVTTA